MCALGNLRGKSIVHPGNPIIAYRAFGRSGSGVLTGTFKSDFGYVKGVNKADRTPKKIRGDMHGFWAFRNATKAREMGRIVAKVALWGTVIQHDLGYRASRLRILEIEGIAPPTPTPQQASAQKYGVPLRMSLT